MSNETYECEHTWHHIGWDEALGEKFMCDKCGKVKYVEAQND